MAKVAVVITILNEHAALPSLFRALERQTRFPDEVIIVDGGSSDESQSLLTNWKPPFSFRWLTRKGNRSVGRNAGITTAKAKYIALTDAGCIPERNWLKQIIAPLEKGKDVAAGYYRAIAHTPFEQAASAYMLVMPERVDENNFLPATRSMALTRSIWKKVGGFPTKFSHNEDYVLAHRLKKQGAKMVFVREAVVAWMPPHNWGSFLKQVSRFAYGDTQAGIIRPKVVSIFLRWIVLLSLVLLRFEWFIILLALYCLWAYLKNRRYVSSIAGIYLLPLMQLSTDLVVCIWSVIGWFNHEKNH